MTIYLSIYTYIYIYSLFVKQLLPVLVLDSCLILKAKLSFLQSGGPYYGFLSLFWFGFARHHQKGAENGHDEPIFSAIYFGGHQGSPVKLDFWGPFWSPKKSEHELVSYSNGERAPKYKHNMEKQRGDGFK